MMVLETWGTNKQLLKTLSQGTQRRILLVPCSLQTTLPPFPPPSFKKNNLIEQKNKSPWRDRMPLLKLANFVLYA